MEEKKLYCKYCVNRQANGYCPKKGFVPKKKTTTGVNIAETCEHFKKK